jgi:hypothetical protein
MPLATYKDLCIDAVDAHAQGAFWAVMLDLEHHPHGDGDGCLRGPSGETVVWVNRVPEPTTVKNRVHLDVRAESVARALEAGATALEAFPRWTVMSDPDEQEFCLFERPDEVIEQRFYEIGWDCADSLEACHRQAEWWAAVLGGEVFDHEEHRFSWLEQIPGAPFESIDFAPVPEPKTAKNRVHLDVTTDDLDALIAHGARVLRPKGDPVEGGGGLGWTVLADPDGNEFCAFTP